MEDQYVRKGSVDDEGQRLSLDGEDSVGMESEGMRTGNFVDEYDDEQDEDEDSENKIG